MSNIRRYARTPVIVAGKKYGTSNIIPIIRERIANNLLPYTTYTTNENERLDIISGQVYGDGRLWWIIAAASGIGWGLQVPSNTLLYIPKLNDVAQLIG
jgi:hypothetical protein